MWGYFWLCVPSGGSALRWSPLGAFLSTLSLGRNRLFSPRLTFQTISRPFAGPRSFVVLGVFLGTWIGSAIRWLMAGGAILLLGATLVLGQATWGRQLDHLRRFLSSPLSSPRSAIFLPEPPRWTGSSGSGIWAL